MICCDLILNGSQVWAGVPPLVGVPNSSQFNIVLGQQSCVLVLYNRNMSKVVQHALL
jgi:hypothetical protein